MGCNPEIDILKGCVSIKENGITWKFILRTSLSVMALLKRCSWERSRKEEMQKGEVISLCGSATNAFRKLIVLRKPILQEWKSSALIHNQVPLHYIDKLYIYIYIPPYSHIFIFIIIDDVRLPLMPCNVFMSFLCVIFIAIVCVRISYD